MKHLARLSLPLLIALLCQLMASSVSAVAVDEERLDDPGLETRARAVSKTLRCLVCQNQSIEDSNAPLAKDLRRTVRERILEGDTDDQIRAYIVARYGDWVLLRPPVKPSTALLWATPVVLILAGGIGIFIFYRRQRASEFSAPEPLSAAEIARLRELEASEASEPAQSEQKG